MKKLLILAGAVILLGVGCQKPNSSPAAEPAVTPQVEAPATGTSATPLTNETLKKAENYQKARELFDRSLKVSDPKLKTELRSQIASLSPESDLGYFARASLLQLQAEPDLRGAVELLTKALSANPNFIFAYINRGANYFSLGEYDKAISDASAAIALNSKMAISYSNRAAAYQKKNMFKEALADLNKAVELDPSVAAVYFGRAEVYAALGQMEKAQADLKKYDEFQVLKVQVEEVKK